MRIATWIVSVLLAALFLFSGVTKLITPLEELAKNGPFVTDIGNFVRLIGVAEVAGALGLILPSATRIMPKLTVAAAIGLLLIMVLAIPVHIKYDQAALLPMPIVVGLLCGFVAWSRAKKATISPR